MSAVLFYCKNKKETIMYNLNTNEILLVDGGGDGGSLKGKIAKEVIKSIGSDYLINSFGRGNYNNHSGIGIGTSQTYGRNGLSVGGQMMGAGRSF